MCTVLFEARAVARERREIVEQMTFVFEMEGESGPLIPLEETVRKSLVTLMGAAIAAVLMEGGERQDECSSVRP